MKISPGWRLRGLLVTCWTTSVRFLVSMNMQMNPHHPTVCLSHSPHVCTLQHKACCCCDSELQKYNWLSRKKHIGSCAKGNHSEHKRKLITGQRCPEFLSAFPTELHVRSRSLSCQLSHAKSVWSLIVFVCKRWGWSVRVFTDSRWALSAASYTLDPAASWHLQNRKRVRTTCTMSPDSERHHKAYRHRQ